MNKIWSQRGRWSSEWQHGPHVLGSLRGGGYRFEQHPVGWLACLQGLDQELEELEAEETIAALQRTHGWAITERV